MVRISVPKTPKDAYKPDRPAGTLLRSQLEHLEWAARPAGERLPGMINVPEDVTERDASDRIAQLMVTLRANTIGRDPVINPKPTRRRRAHPARAKRARKRARRRTTR
jgi:hypothetical protein